MRDVPTLDDQIAELRAELALRDRVFPAWVKTGRIKRDVADRRRARMQAAHDTLVRVQKMEHALRQAAKQFRFYASQHMAKPTPDNHKASVNIDMAELMEAALAQPEPQVAVRVVGPHGEALP